MALYMTTGCADRLRSELHFLLTEERPRVVQVVSWAASNGDRSENADYQYGKRRLREIDRRIHFLQKRLEEAVPIDPSQITASTIQFGASVLLEGEDGETKQLTIVGPDEINLKAGLISYQSPVAKAIIGKKVGDWITVTTPIGEREYLVRELLYGPIP